MKIRVYISNGYHWLGVKINGKVMLISKVGNVGDCLRY
jgi:hypothetical protein